MKLNFVVLLKGLGVKAMTELAGWQAWLINAVLNKLIKAIISAWNKAMSKLEDDKTLKKYVNEIAKGKEADEQAKVDSQLDIVNPKHK